MSRGVGRSDGRLVICERVGGMTVGVWRWGEIHIHTRLCVLPVDQTPAVRQARSMKKSVFVCEVSAGMRVATARALRSVMISNQIIAEAESVESKIPHR